MENAILKLGFEHIISFVTMQIIVLYLFYLYRPFFLITFGYDALLIDGIY